MHVDDLVKLGLYFCLWYCEYIKCKGHHRKVQLRPLLEFVFFIREYLLPADAPIDKFQHVTQIILTLDNHNNAI